MRASGPTRIGSIRRSRAASTAPPSEASSHGCAIATFIGVSACAALIRRWYFRAMPPQVDPQCQACAVSALTAFCWPHAEQLSIRARRRGPRRTSRHARQEPGAGHRALPCASLIVTQQPRHSIEGTFLIEANQQVLLPHDLLEPRDSFAWPRGATHESASASRSHAHRRCPPAAVYRPGRAARPLPARRPRNDAPVPRATAPRAPP